MNAPTLPLESVAAAPRAPEAGIAPSLERKRLRVYLLQMVVDIALLFGSFALAAYFYKLAGGPGGRPLLAAQLLLPLFLTIAWHNDTYSLNSLTDWRSSSLRLVLAILISAALLNFLAFFVSLNAVFSRVVFVAGLAIALPAMVTSRAVAARWIRKNWGPSPINRLVIDAGGPPMLIPHAYRLDAIEHGLIPSLEDPHALDRLARYLRNMDEVIVNCPLEQRGLWAKALKGSGVHGEVTSELVREIGVLGVIHRDDANVSTLLTGRWACTTALTDRPALP